MANASYNQVIMSRQDHACRCMLYSECGGGDEGDGVHGDGGGEGGG